MAVAVGSNPIYPSLQSAMDLFRALVNAKDVAANSATFVLPFLNSAIQDTYSDLRVVGAPRLIRDGVIVTGLPALSVPNPAVQPFLSYSGFFDGFQMHGGLTLPPDLMTLERVWQRQTGANGDFIDLPGREAIGSFYQNYGMGSWEWRNDAIYFGGSTIAVDLRLRYMATYPDFLGTSLDFTKTYIPIIGCLNAVVYKMVAKYAFRLSPEQFPLAKQESEEYITKLKQEIVLSRQAQSGHR